MLYLGSLFLGLFAWFLPVIALFWRRIGGSLRKRQVCGILSALACSAAIWFELYAGVLLVEREDAAALYDTLPAAAKLALILLAGTVLVNGLLLMKRDKA